MGTQGGTPKHQVRTLEGTPDGLQYCLVVLVGTRRDMWRLMKGGAATF